MCFVTIQNLKFCFLKFKLLKNLDWAFLFVLLFVRGFYWLFCRSSIHLKTVTFPFITPISWRTWQTLKHQCCDNCFGIMCNRVIKQKMKAIGQIVFVIPPLEVRSLWRINFFLGQSSSWRHKTSASWGDVAKTIRLLLSFVYVINIVSNKLAEHWSFQVYPNWYFYTIGHRQHSKSTMSCTSLLCLLG